MIDVQGITKRFGATVAVDNVSFKFRPGEVLGFLGPNGAGKTTTLRVLTGYLDPDAGDVKLDDFTISSQPLEIRKRIGYLPESSPIYPEMRADEYLGFIAEVRRIPPRGRKSRSDEVIKICGLEPVLKKNVSELSRGYRQRLGLAQALIHDPEYLILDEPTSGLDPNQIVEIRQLIKRIGKQKAIILSTHILPEVEATCDRIIIINWGRLIASGTARELTEKFSGEDSLSVVVKGPGDDVLRVLKNVPGARSCVDAGTDGHDGVRVRLSGVEGPRTAEAVFKAVAENGWTLRELTPQRLTLEQVFQRLTSEGGDGA